MLLPAVGAPLIGTAFETATAGTTSAVPYPVGMGAGYLMVLGVATGGSASTTTTTPATWTLVKQMASTTDTVTPNLGVWVKYATGSESGTLTVSHGSIVNSAQIIAFPGVDQVTAQDVAFVSLDATVAALTSVHTGMTIVTPGAAMVLVAAQNNVTSTATPPTGMTETVDRVLTSARAWEMSYQLGLPAGATGSRTINWTGSARSVAIAIALRPAATPVAVPQLTNRVAVMRASTF